MSQADEDLQNKFERGEDVIGNTIESEAYRRVFRVLDSTVSSPLSQNFADRVIQALVARQRRESRRDIWLFSIGFAFLLIAFVVAVVYTGFSLEMGFLKKIANYSGVFAFGIAFVIVLSILERKLISKLR